MADKRYVLIVDDNEDVRQLFYDIVELSGFTPRAVGSGVAALQQLKTTPFDLVILDMRMPDLNGLDTFKAIRQFNSSVPVVLTTGFGMDKSVQEALSMGALLCIEKPFNVARTMKTIQDIVEKESPKK
ncbi:MAG: response regulator [Candidatus Abyssobacteria bacterium SURF_17]|uniref:Response regulator n=1 Tax=Candidatus Abyssobacteria bacterium SURF_17 TaxID=2093361 RepID=A0A419EVL6_9BACT|nr:MAG: response regulator [Candidatus Abyssubacteria bacterium SURF_17]